MNHEGSRILAAQNAGNPNPRAHPAISAVIVSCDESEVIRECLRSVVWWVDEIVVVDMHSTDGTREIIGEFPVKLFDHERLDHAEPARMFAVDQARGDWILALDPDERIPRGLARELTRIARRGAADAVIIPFDTWVFGAPLRAPWLMDENHLRFFRRGAVSLTPALHGGFKMNGRRAVDLPRRPQFTVRHETSRTVAARLDKLRRYSAADAALRHDAGATFSARAMLDAMWGAFESGFVQGRGYEDGMRGLFVALLGSAHEMATYMQLWEAEGWPETGDRNVRTWGRRLEVALGAAGRLKIRAVGRAVFRFMSKR
jgi:hypothetical protein